MGMWDAEAWDNDSAADWFADFMDTTGVREFWLRGINSDLEDEPEVVRAALWLFVQLGRTYIWPIEHLNSDLDLAINAARALLNIQHLADEVPDYVSGIENDLQVLQLRVTED